jgi:hypothetical protein
MTEEEIGKEKALMESYIEYLREFCTKINEDILRQLGFESIQFINEVMCTNPMQPWMKIKKLDGTEETIKGVDNISKKLNKLLEKV